MNSYRFHSKNEKNVRVFSDKVAEEDIYRKKRAREDEYIHDIDAGHRPILLIQKKEVFENLNAPETLPDPAQRDRYFKVSKNTKLIEDLDSEISIQKPAIARRTRVHRLGAERAEREVSPVIYKIKGMEYLPEGFLELDPMLFKDEYVFPTKFVEKKFEHEQRRLKTLRRKQYTQKDYQKAREVIIYVLDEFNEDIVAFLEKWYFKHKRRMDPTELAYAGQKFNVSPELMARLQELYLRRKKSVNSKALQGYFRQNPARSTGRFEDLPAPLQQFVWHNKSAYDGVESKVGQMIRSHSQTGLQPLVRPLSPILARGKSGSRTLRGSGEIRRISPVPFEPAAPKAEISDEGRTLDIEFLKLMEEIKGAKKDELPRTNPSILHSDEHQTERQRRQTRPTETEEAVRVSVVAAGPQGKVAEQKLRPVLIGRSYFFQTVRETIDLRGNRSLSVITRNDRGRVVSEQTLDPRASGYFKNEIEFAGESGRDIGRESAKDTIRESLKDTGRESLKDSGKTVRVRVVNDLGKILAVQNHSPKEARRVTDALGREGVEVMSDKERVFKMRPILLGAQYVMQSVIEKSSGGNEGATLVTSDEEGTVLSMIDLRKEVLAPSYSFEATELKILGGERVYTLATFDHLGREIARQDIRLKPNAAENLDTLVEEIVTRNGEREIAILRKRSGTGRFTLHSTLVRGSASRLEPIGEGEEDDADLVDHTRKSSAKPSRKATEVSRPRDSEDRMEWIDQAVRESKNHKESMEERAEYRHKQSTFHNLHYEEILDLAEHELLLDTRTVPSLMSEEYSRLSATQEPRTTTKSVKFTGEETRSRGETQALSSQLPEELSERKASSPRRASSEAVPSEETYLNRFERKKSSVDSKQKRENSRERLSKKTSTTSLNPPQSSKVSKGVGAESLARESEA